MKIVEIMKMVTNENPESEIVRTLNAVKTFCAEQNVFIEDVEYEVIATNELIISDNYSGILLLISLDLDVLRRLHKETKEIVNKHTDIERDSAIHWDELCDDLEKLEKTYNEDSN